MTSVEGEGDYCLEGGVICEGSSRHCASCVLLEERERERKRGTEKEKEEQRKKKDEEKSRKKRKGK